jgi:flagellar biosynthesis protein FliQ
VDAFRAITDARGSMEDALVFATAMALLGWAMAFFNHWAYRQMRDLARQMLNDLESIAEDLASERP